MLNWLMNTFRTASRDRSAPGDITGSSSTVRSRRAGVDTAVYEASRFSVWSRSVSITRRRCFVVVLVVIVGGLVRCSHQTPTQKAQLFLRESTRHFVSFAKLPGTDSGFVGSVCDGGSSWVGVTNMRLPKVGAEITTSSVRENFKNLFWNGAREKY